MKQTSLSMAVLFVGTVAVTGVCFTQISDSSASALIPGGSNALPSDAKPGHCYARVWQEPQYKTITEKVLKREATERLEIVPAEYQWTTETVMVREAYEKLVVVAAQYDTISEKVLVKPMTTRWKKGRGLIEKVDNFTGEIMCLENMPAEYITVTRQVLKSPSTVKMVHVPAEYTTVKVKRILRPAKEIRIPVPAVYESVSKTVLANEGRMVWQSVLCETNLQPAQKSVARRHDGVHARSAAALPGSEGRSAAKAANPWVQWGFK